MPEQDDVPMDDGPLATPTPVTEDELTDDERASLRPSKPDPADAPDDVDDEVATGYAVYDRTLGRYVSAVTPDKPSKSDISKVVAKGHSHKVVRV